MIASADISLRKAVRARLLATPALVARLVPRQHLCPRFSVVI